jgi:hypothetical protein
MSILPELKAMNKFKLEDSDKSCKFRFYIILRINSSESSLNLEKTYQSRFTFILSFSLRSIFQLYF